MNQETSNVKGGAAVACSALLADFKRERNEALLSLDEQKLRAFHRKWNESELPDDRIVFWGAIHKAITGCLDLPIEFRRKSKTWLDERGFKSFDDGDLSTNDPSSATRPPNA